MEEPRTPRHSFTHTGRDEDLARVGSVGAKVRERAGFGSTDDKVGFNRIICGSSEDMREIANQTVHLIVTSPPYCVGKEYEAEQSFEDWFVLMKKVCAEMRRVLVPGGRACINVAGIGRNPYRPTHYYVTGIMLNLGFLMRGEIIWNKGASAGESSAWGSWCSASNPVLRDTHEYVLVFSKETMSREKSGGDSISRDGFLQATRSVWDIPAESVRRIGHPSPFPLELPKRLIGLYSFEGDVVLDPFCGSGTTCVAALELNRRYVGYDIVPGYCELTRDRIRQAREIPQWANLNKSSDRRD
jgi:site-specific DNA-methyltransferase (adenine-specific)